MGDISGILSLVYTVVFESNEMSDIISISVNTSLNIEKKYRRLVMKRTQCKT